MSSDESLPLAEERLSIHKHTVTTGRVRIKTAIDERKHWIHESLEHEAVTVERVAVDRIVDEIPQIRQVGDVVIIPVVEEVAVVERRLLLKEEIHVSKRRYVESVDEPVTLKSTRAVIERD